MTNRFLDFRLVRQPAYTTMLRWWMGASAQDAALAQLIAITEIWKRNQQDDAKRPWFLDPETSSQ